LEGKKDQIEAFKAGQISGFTMETKAIIGSADSIDAYTGDVVPADYVPGFKFDPERRVHVRQFLPVGTTNSDKNPLYQRNQLHRQYRRNCSKYCKWTK
jgi:hypothetical protein